LSAGGLAELLQRHAVGAEHVDADLGDTLRHRHDVGEVAQGRDVENAARRGFWNHQVWPGARRHDVEEGERLGDPRKPCARDLAAQDLGEDVALI
jgi:hypothetical protein